MNNNAETFKIENGNLVVYNGHTDIGNKNIIIPDSVTSIGDTAF